MSFNPSDGMKIFTMTTRTLNKSENSYKDLLKFGYVNLSESREVAQKVEEQSDKIDKYCLKLRKVLPSDFSKLLSTFDGDKHPGEEINNIISKLQFYQKLEQELDVLWRSPEGDSYYTNITGVSSCLTGIYFDQIQELNKYVYTTSSTEYPEDPEENEMYIAFYTLKSIAGKIAEFCSKTKYNYGVFQGLKGEKRLWGELKEDTEDFPLLYLNQFKQLFYREDPLVYVFIIDPVKRNRDLYEIVLSFVKSSVND